MKRTPENGTGKKLNTGAKVLLIILGILVVLAAAFLALSAKKEVHVNLQGDEEVIIPYGSQYTEEGAEALWESRVFPFINGELEVSAEGSVDGQTLGEYKITYRAEYKGITGEAVRTVTVKDEEPPVITLETKPDYYTLPGQPYAEEGFKAVDNHDGDVTAQVKAVEKDGTVTYTVSDSSGNEASAERKIFYDDRTAPEIFLDGDDTVLVGEEWNGTFTASDNVDGDITDKVQVEGSVDINTPGTYTIKYTVEDKYKNKAEAERTVTVLSKNRGTGAWGEAVSGDKIVFLTFDDGPGPYTERLLEILGRYEVPATFFVTNQFPGYQYLIGAEAAAGHTVAVHTYSHEYSYIYSSIGAYWEDFDRMNDVIESQTGSRSDVFRFPGGSSNMVSASYCSGIMTALTDQATEMGLDYYDWNVSSGDAGETTSSAQVAANVIAGMQSTGVSVVLMHDIHDYTVDAIEEIIKYGLANGYTFMRLEKGSTYCHHGVNN